MQFYSNDHVYECEVPGFQGKGMTIGLKVVPPKEFDKLQAEFRGLTMEGITEKTNEMIFSKVAFVKGYELTDGTEIKTGKELYEKGLPEIWSFVQRAIFDSQVLSKAEVKNS